MLFRSKSATARPNRAVVAIVAIAAAAVAETAGVTAAVIALLDATKIILFVKQADASASACFFFTPFSMFLMEILNILTPC